MTRRAYRDGSVSGYQTRTGAQRWRIQWREPKDPRKPELGNKSAGKAGFRTEDEARAELHVRLARAASGKTTPDARSERIRFDSYARRWLAGYACEPNTRSYIARVIDDVEQHIGHLRLGDILPSDLAACYRALEQGIGRAATAKGGGPLASSTVSRYAGWLVTIFNVAVEEDLIAKNPASHRLSGRPKGARAKRQKPITVWTPEQTREFCSWATENEMPWAPAYELLVRTGLRIGELFGLEWPDLDLARGKMTIARQIRAVSTSEGTAYQVAPPKGGRPRTISLDDESVQLLQDLRRAQLSSAIPIAREARHRVFPGRPGAVARKGAFLHAFLRAQTLFAKAHSEMVMPTLDSHDLRHTHASLLLAAGVDIKVIQERLGHATAKLTLDTYSHLMPDAHDAAMGKLSGLLKPAKRDLAQDDAAQ